MHFPSDATIKKLEKNPLLSKKACEDLRPKYLGPLYDIEFYRIVLDEAHAIKNHASQSSTCSAPPAVPCFRFLVGSLDTDKEFLLMDRELVSA